MQGSISNDQNFKMHFKTNGEPMKGLKHRGNVRPPCGPNQKPCSRVLYNLYSIHRRFIQTSVQNIAIV